jgi:tetratricopeptide (TPR) repeat protein
MGCSEEKRAVSEIRDSFEAGEYRETVAFCRHAVRRGIDAPEVYLYHGKSLVLLGRDFEAFGRLEAAVARDPMLAAPVGRFLLGEGERAFVSGRREQAAARFRRAVEIDPSLDPGVYIYLVGDHYYEEPDYGKAAAAYAKAVANYPDTTAAEPAYVNMAACYRNLGMQARAQAALETLLDLYPHSPAAAQARWDLVNILYERGEKKYLSGHYEETIGIVAEIMTRTRNPGLRQKSRFLLGETYEAMGELDRAYEYYQQVIQKDRGASGRIVERAREKIAALREAGLY